MSRYVKNIPFTVPAGSPLPASWVEDVNLGWSNVSNIKVVFPPGCSGLVGVQFLYALNVVYPTGSSPWFIMDDYVLDIPVDGQSTGGQWRINAFNNDYYQHILQVYFSYDDVDNTGQSTTSSLVSL